MEGKHRIGISSFTYCFACGTRPDHKQERVMTPLELIDKAVALGVQVVQFGDNMPMEKCSTDELDMIRTYAEEHGIELEAGMRKATPERLAEYIDISKRIGARVLRVITDGPDFQPDLEEFCRILSAAVPQLEESGVCLGIENHDRFSAQEYAAMVETVGHPQVRLTVDSVNSLSHEETVSEVLKYMAPYCICLHMKDYVIKRYNGGGGLKVTGACLGTGRLDAQNFYEECRTRSDSGFSVILESWMEPCETLEETLQREEDWAEKSVEYLKKMI